MSPRGMSGSKSSSQSSGRANRARTAGQVPANQLASQEPELQTDEHTHLLGAATTDKRRQCLRPMHWWYIVLMFCIATSSATTLAPMIGLLTDVICDDYGKTGQIPNHRMGFFSGLAVGKAGSQSPMERVQEPSRTCASDPEVQAGVTTILAAQIAIMGFLSCLTAAWWGSFSDRHGRTRVIALCGLPFTDIACLLVGLYPTAVPGGHRFVLVGPVIQGLLGGMSALMSTIQAYIADCTEDSSRARAFSLFLGAIFAGSAFGPSLGSMLIRLTGQPLSVFIFSVAVCTAASACSWLVVPESLHPAQLAAARSRYREGAARQSDSRGVGWLVAPLWGVVRPLSVFLPHTARGESGKCDQADWSLMLLAVAYGSFNMIWGIQSYLLQYAGARLDFSVEMMGYAISVAGATKAIYLTVCFPVALKMLCYLLPASSLPRASTAAPPAATSSRPTQEPAAPNAFSLNLALARLSAAFESAVYIWFPFISNAGWFMAAMGAGSIGTGFNPTVQSLAIEVYARRGDAAETGKLFGALSVVQALCSHIIGPAIFGVVCVNTLSTAPSVLFFVATAFTAIAFVTLGFVRSPSQHLPDSEDGLDDHTSPIGTSPSH